MNQYCTQCGHAAVKKSDNLYVCDQGHQNWINAAPGATVYVIRDGKVVFGIRNIEPHIGKLDLPGGFLDYGETAEQAAVREVKEELGIDIELMHILGTYADTYNGRPTINVVFIANYIDGQLAPSDDLNGGEPVWRAIDDLPTRAEIGWDWYLPAQADLEKWWQKARNVS